MTKPFRTKKQIAVYLQVTPRTVENWMARGMPHYKLGTRRTRFDLEQVKAWLKEFEVIREPA